MDPPSQECGTALSVQQMLEASVQRMFALGRVSSQLRFLGWVHDIGRDATTPGPVRASVPEPDVLVAGGRIGRAGWGLAEGAAQQVGGLCSRGLRPRPLQTADLCNRLLLCPTDSQEPPSPPGCSPATCC